MPTQPRRTAKPKTVNVGGIPATLDEVRSAIDILTSTTWIMVRQPLSAAQHPLAQCRYLDVAREQRRLDGDRTVSTKVAVIHALERMLAEQ